MSEFAQTVLIASIPGLLIAALTIVGTQLTIRANAKKRTAEEAKLEAEKELKEVEADYCVAGMYHNLLQDLRDELTRQDEEHDKEIASLNANLAAVKAEQEYIKEHYQAQIEALEVKVVILKRELERERKLRIQLQKKYEGSVGSE
jgi:hypothetical protein